MMAAATMISASCLLQARHWAARVQRLRWSIGMAHLAIAKFPQHGDLFRASLWEAVALKLAAQAGIPTPDWRVEKIADRDVLLLRRFDRRSNVRIPFLSAMSLSKCRRQRTAQLHGDRRRLASVRGQGRR